MLTHLRKRSVFYFICLLFAVASGHATAAGSLAIDTLQGEKYGFSFNHPSVDLADQRSMRECGANCTVVLRFSGQCAAYAADQTKGSNAYGWAEGAVNASTQARAMSECRTRGGASCKVRAWGCDAGTATAPQAVAPQVATPQPTRPQTAAPDASPRASASPAQPNVPAPQNNPAASSGFAMLGDWLVDYVSPTGYTATGSMRVSESLGNGSFRGVMIQAFVSTSGEPKRVQQDVIVTVRGDSVNVAASNPVYLLGKGSYSADNFSLTMASANLMRGKNNDSSGVGGAVVISRK